jgi:hypothetical protein
MYQRTDQSDNRRIWFDFEFRPDERLGLRRLAVPQIIEIDCGRHEVAVLDARAPQHFVDLGADSDPSIDATVFPSLAGNTVQGVCDAAVTDDLKIRARQSHERRQTRGVRIMGVDDIRSTGLEDDRGNARRDPGVQERDRFDRQTDRFTATMQSTPGTREESTRYSCSEKLSMQQKNLELASPPASGGIDVNDVRHGVGLYPKRTAQKCAELSLPAAIWMDWR